MATEKPIPRSKIKVPMALAVGKYELLTDEELYDHLHDLLAETRRRGSLRPSD